MTQVNDLQRTDEWYAARLGKLTASSFHMAVARTRSGWGASRANYRAQLVCERLTGRPTEFYVNAAMQRGIDMEPKAKALYSLLSDNNIQDEGFVDHPKIAMSGASPDGLIGDDGMIEIKCPNTATHIETLLYDNVDTKYVQQMQWQMACTGRQWCVFVSFDDRLPPAMQLYQVVYPRDNKMISEMEDQAVKFLNEVDDEIVKLTEKYNG